MGEVRDAGKGKEESLWVRIWVRDGNKGIERIGESLVEDLGEVRDGGRAQRKAFG